MIEVRAEWQRRVVAEYRSAAVTHHLVLWYIQIGASPDLIRDGLRIVEQELGHAELSLEVLAAAGGQAPAPVDRRTLALPASEPLEHAVLRATVELFCLGETVAVPLFRRMLRGTTQPDARRVLRKILVDEAEHRRFGWEALEWLLSVVPEGRALLQTELPAMLARINAGYGVGVRAELPEEDRAWGLLAPAEYGEELAWAMRRWYRPRFAALGITL